MNYIIFNKTLGNVGGAEIYTSNKAQYLERLGYSVKVFSSMNDTIIIDYLNRFQECIIPELMVNPYLFSVRVREQIIKKVCSIITSQQYDRIVLETHTIPMAIWGELIGQRINALNFVFLLDDEFKPISSSITSFLLYKLQKRELVGIAYKSMDLIFPTHKIPAEQHYFLNAYCSNSIQQIENSISLDLNNYDIQLGIISRLEKRSVMIACEEILRFALSNQNKNIFLLIIGGSTNHTITQKIYKLLSKCRNLTVCITGYLYPIPIELIMKIPFYIGIAGAAKATADLGIPTLVLEQRKAIPLGILYVNTSSTQYVDENYQYHWMSLSEALQDLLICNNETVNLTSLRLENKYEFNTPDYSQHLVYLDSLLSVTYDYYLFPSTFHSQRIKKFIFNILYTFIGLPRIFYIYMLCRTIFHKK